MVSVGALSRPSPVPSIGPSTVHFSQSILFFLGIVRNRVRIDLVILFFWS